MPNADEGGKPRRDLALRLREQNQKRAQGNRPDKQDYGQPLFFSQLQSKPVVLKIPLINIQVIRIGKQIGLNPIQNLFANRTPFQKILRGQLQAGENSSKAAFFLHRPPGFGFCAQ